MTPLQTLVAVAVMGAFGLGGWLIGRRKGYPVWGFFMRAILGVLGQAILAIWKPNSSRNVRAAPGWSAFAASKAALQELADSVRAQEAEHGVRVTTIYPGATATEHLRQVRAAFGRGYDPERCIAPETLAATVAWVLAAPPDAYVSELSVLAVPRRH